MERHASHRERHRHIRCTSAAHSTVAPANQPHDEHHVIADAWIARAIDGIRQMHGNENVRREVARGIF
ncbi:hypothetical protein [Burkholderia pyrrocinia]|uniref:hypothetical protein n=1 Tax=Burkholderia pyrrocinia TaxID=60550 RepID=UPI001ABB880B|nr:hypothetical protein [Burkholderia pyrrocinia]